MAPGYFIGDYISGRRQVSFPPVNMLFIVAALYAIIKQLLGINMHPHATDNHPEPLHQRLDMSTDTLLHLSHLPATVRLRRLGHPVAHIHVLPDLDAVFDAHHRINIHLRLWVRHNQLQNHLRSAGSARYHSRRRLLDKQKESPEISLTRHPSPSSVQSRWQNRWWRGWCAVPAPSRG
ncbi:MAG: DUF3667 domain-containing protein [Bacteroidales bacterium]|nr:DUF3667 domain-containing protein [Bacteroidales bacterium]